MRLPIIDTHQHLWDLRRFHLPWVRTGERLGRSFLTRDYLKAVRGLNVVKSVYMEVAVATGQITREALHAIDLCEDAATPTVGAVISGRPDSEDFGSYLRSFSGCRTVKGMRRILHPGSAPRGLCLKKRFVRNVGLLGDHGLLFDLCMRPGELADGARLAGRCPGTRFVVDHCGNADPKAFMKRPPERPSHEADAWKRDMDRLAARKNVVCKISGIVARAPRPSWSAEHLAPIVDHCLDAFGPDRVVFGSDWPVCLTRAPLAHWIRALRAIIRHRPAAYQRKLLSGNAIKVYGLK